MQINQKTISYLLSNACPSIKYRVKKEILHENTSTSAMKALQTQILNEEKIKYLFSLRKSDGWLGGLFHGTEEPESIIRFLTEKGVEPSHQIIQNALSAIIARDEKFDLGSLNNVGKPLDSMHIGGSKLIRACVFAYAGNEAYDFVLEQIKESLDAFEYVCEVERIEDIYKPYKDKLVFRDGVRWPCIYHLRLLAYTNCWRNNSNKAMLEKSINNLVKFSPVPSVKLLYKSQIISPASVFMNNFDNDMDSLNQKEWMMWFHRTELVSRLGIANKIDSIKNQIDYVNTYLDENHGLFVKKMRHYYFTKWTQYIGLALEDDWKTSAKIVNDLTFRCALINSYL